jgi:hypothetical protein
MLLIKDRVDGARVAPQKGAGRDRHLGACRERGQRGGDAECARADEQQSAATDPVAQRAHRDK